MARMQIVQPAGAGHETRWVLAGLTLVLVVAAATIAWRTGGKAQAPVSAGSGVDARFDLNPAEQGLHADLSVAADEVAALLAESGTAPEPEELAAAAVPPFATPPGGDTRGAHGWRRLQAGGFVAYLGLPSLPDRAAALLLRVEVESSPAAAASGHHHALAGRRVWLHRGPATTAPQSLDDRSLLEAGWQPVFSRFDSGVTRRQSH